MLAALALPLQNASDKNELRTEKNPSHRHATPTSAQVTTDLKKKSGDKIAGEKAPAAQSSPAAADGNGTTPVNAPTATTEDSEPLPAFLSLPLFLSGSWLETPAASPAAVAAGAMPAVSTVSNPLDPSDGTLDRTVPATAAITAQNAAWFPQVGVAASPSAKLQSVGLQNECTQSEAKPGATTALATSAKAGVTAKADPNSAVADPESKAAWLALPWERGGTAAVTQIEPALAPVGTPAEPVAASQAGDSESGQPAGFGTFPAPMPGEQIGAATSDAWAQPDVNAGTGVAMILSSMKNPQNTNKVAGADVKVLPVGENGESGEPNLPALARAAEARGTDLNFLADGGAHAPATEHASAFSVVDLPSLAEARLRALDRTHDMMALHAMRLVESTSDALSVVIKPAVGTELSLELRQHGGSVEAQATLTRGDRDFLSQHWPELQQRLEQRGIKLSSLGGSADMFTSDTANSNGNNHLRRTPHKRLRPSRNLPPPVRWAAPQRGWRSFMTAGNPGPNLRQTIL